MEVLAADRAFADFVEAYSGKLTLAFTAMYGADRGRDAAAEALAYAWEHWERVRTMERPVGYLYRVGQSKTRRRRVPPAVDATDVGHAPWVEPGLPEALRGLTRRQRTAVVLVHAYDWTHAEAAELLGIRPPTVKKHVQRGLAKLRRALGVSNDA